MPKGKDQKLKLYRLAQIMVEKTDEDHMLDIGQIRQELGRYDITADRKSLYDDFRALEVMGIKVEGEKVGRNYYYHVIGKPFEIAETKLLVDAIQSSKFITEKKSRQLIKKLTANVSEYEAHKLSRQVVVSGRIKTMNESIYYNVDEIHNAITDNKKIRFEYLKWNLKKELVPRKEDKYEVSPWALTWDDENYYLIGYDGEEEKIKHYRVDKMRGITMIDKPRDGKKIFDEFDMATYSKESFGMYGGIEKSLHIRFRDELVGVMIDRFGKDILIHPAAEPGFSETHVNVAVSNQFFGWMFGIGEDVEIIAPEDVRSDFEKLLKSVAGRYGYDNNR
ncbi:MAG: WYL domain-containing protein [Lachnospiraceae bacterium]|nr:WYL domain-containing protein [Lachnospiraceae bacterium]